ncbi:unnamed protein product (macronuclear) [Paramecium tetraurelia]|uniref:Uncharacterized protein n=1 Tax=Paramecium tetraurelia TaxID=5888 RepID=A0BII5_PARTE|nr:uncharacterized protein GSPATT00004724001 [Paramecium tetraurelia]CAK58352.1 unnamed protein product [Paramecium tetraurelia]|eukprot:XP_001425750.1 hypothetical protein (macronuclear) [Paramecium tetraurelia strain d4-2]
MDQVCQQQGNQSNNQPKIIENEELFSYRRINVPGLPISSLRTNCKGDKKRLEIGLISDRKLSDVPNFDSMFSAVNSKFHQQKNSIGDIPQPQSQAPKMEPQAKRNLRMIEKLESDKLCLKIYMSEEDSNQIIFTGISKEQLQSPTQNKKELIQKLQKLFENNITQTNESKSFTERSLSISKIQEYEQNAPANITKDLEILENELNCQVINEQQYSNSNIYKPYPLSQQNLTLNLRQKQKSSKISSQTINGPSYQQRNSEYKCMNKIKTNAKSLHVTCHS